METPSTMQLSMVCLKTSQSNSVLGKNGEFRVSALKLGGEINYNRREVLRLVDRKESESGMNASKGKVWTNLPFGLVCDKRSRNPKRNSINKETKKDKMEFD